MRKTVHVIDADYLICKMFEKKGYKFEPRLSADIVVWPGGSDVYPGLYHDVTHPTTWYHLETDNYHKMCWDQTKKEQIKIGICRGAQFLNVMNGGKLYQDVDKHALRGTHECVYYFNNDNGIYDRCQVTSTHHQMMKPDGDFIVCGWALESTYKDQGEDRKKKSIGVDFEIVQYPYTKTLCFQPHPEYDHKETCDLFFKCLERMF